MERFSPKIEIINHFDDLIHKVDIDIEENIEKYNENQLLRELECFKVENRNFNYDYDSRFKMEFFKSCESSYWIKEQTVDQWSESTKVVDYLNQVRMTTIEELRKEQSESVENSSRFNSLINSELTKEEKRSEMFAEKFYFQVKSIKEDNQWVFNLFTFVTDFYISQSYINLLEKLINNKERNAQDFIFDEKLVLIALLYKCFCDNIDNQKFPNHMIHVFKNDVSKIVEIYYRYSVSAVKLYSSTIDLSKLTNLNLTTESELDHIIIDSLYSLKYLSLKFDSVKEISIKNLYALKELYFFCTELFNLQTDLFDHLPNIEIFSFINDMIDFVFHKLEKSIEFCKNLDSNFYFFMNQFFNDIEKLKIEESNIKKITCLLSKFHFPNLKLLSILCCDIPIIEKKLFDTLPTTIQRLDIHNSKLKMIDHDAFSNFKQLVCLDLSENSIESLDRRHFLRLINLESLYLYGNRLKRIENYIFSDLKNLKSLDLSKNQLKSLEANTFAALRNLKKLDLSRNKFKKIDPDLFSNLTQLVSLDLSHNSIESLDRKLLSGLISLEILYLSYNRYKRLDEEMFSDLKNLKSLDFYENQLKKLDTNTFVGLENLNELNLNDNILTYFDIRILDNLPRLEKIYLAGNEISNIIEIKETLNLCEKHLFY